MFLTFDAVPSHWMIISTTLIGFSRDCSFDVSVLWPGQFVVFFWVIRSFFLVRTKKKIGGTKGLFRAKRFFKLTVFELSDLHCSIQAAIQIKSRQLLRTKVRALEHITRSNMKNRGLWNILQGPTWKTVVWIKQQYKHITLSLFQSSKPLSLYAALLLLYFTMTYINLQNPWSLDRSPH